MVTTAYEAVCWYEYLKVFPKTDRDSFNKCTKKAVGSQHAVKRLNPKTEEKAIEDYQVQINHINLLAKLPSEYNAKCGKYIEKHDAQPEYNEAQTLKDNNAENYPFKALAYCLISTLGDKHGAEAIEAVEDERTLGHKDWRELIGNRENEFRARHGAKPLKQEKELEAYAQAWAETNARTCAMDHSDEKQPDRTWHGEVTGENLSSGSQDDEPEIAAYLAADGWYEENKDYPWPEYTYTGKADDPLFHAIGHFTQSVWKETGHVGYGYAYNKNCPKNKFYIAARYSPSGNAPGQYGKNVLNPQD